MISKWLNNTESHDDSLRKEATDQILGFRDSDTGAFIVAMLEESENQEETEHARCLALVLLQQTFNQYKFDQISDDVLEKFSNASLQLIQNSNPSISHAAGELFGFVSAPLIQSGSYPWIIQQICGLLRPDLPSFTVDSAICSVVRISKRTEFTPSQCKAIVSPLIGLIFQQSHDSDAILALSFMASDVANTFHEAKDFGQIASQVLEAMARPECKASAYIFWMSLLKESTPTVVPYIGQLFRMISDDLKSSEDSSVMIQSCRFLMKVTKLQIARKSLLFDYSYFDLLIDPLLRVRSMFPPNEIDEESSWNHYLAAAQAILRLCEAFPSHSSKVMYECAEKYGGLSSYSLEMLLFCHRMAIFSSEPRSFDESFSIAMELIQNPHPRVRNNAIWLLYTLTINFIESEDKDEVSKLLSTLPTLITLYGDTSQNAGLSLMISSLLSAFPNFPVKDVLYKIFPCITSPDPIINNYAFEATLDILERRPEMKNAELILEPTIELLELSFSDSRLGQDNLADLISKIIDICTVGLLPYLPKLMELFTRSIAAHFVLPIANCSKAFGNDFEPYLDASVEYILSVFSYATDFYDIKACCLAIFQISELNSFGSEIPEVVKTFIASILPSGSHCNSKGVILMAIGDLISDFPVESSAYFSDIESIVSSLTDIDESGVLEGSLKCILTLMAHGGSPLFQLAAQLFTEIKETEFSETFDEAVLSLFEFIRRLQSEAAAEMAQMAPILVNVFKDAVQFDELSGDARELLEFVGSPVPEDGDE